MSFINIMDIVYPIGSLYFSSSSTSPANLFGGTWTCVQKDFVPETLISAKSKRFTTTHTSTEAVDYAADIQNGSIALYVNFSNKRMFGGKDYYEPVIWKSFLTDTNSTRVNWDVGVTMVPAVHAMGGEFPQNYSGFMNDYTRYINEGDNPSLLRLYNKTREITYGAASAVSFLEIPSRTQCYIWMRTA